MYKNLSKKGHFFSEQGPDVQQIQDEDRKDLCTVPVPTYLSSVFLSTNIISSFLQKITLCCY